MKFSVLFFDIYGLSMALHGLVFILQHLLCGSGMDSSRHHSSWHSMCYVSSSCKEAIRAGRGSPEEFDTVFDSTFQSKSGNESW